MKSRRGRHPVDGSTMLIEERRQHVLALLQQNGRVLVSELSDELGISRITIRKDLDYLEGKGLIQRSHGGALLPNPSALSDPSLREKEHQHHKEKRRIAETATTLIAEGQCVLLDSGTTTTCIARLLRTFNSLTVITNAVNIAVELANTNVDVILTGGMLRKNSFSLVGPQAEDMLREIHADTLFLGVDGFDPTTGVTTPNVLEARVNRAMVHAARKTVVVCDSTKFHRRSLANIVPLSNIHTVITDSGMAHEDAARLRDAGIEVMIV